MYEKIELIKNYNREQHLKGLYSNFSVSKISPENLSKLYSSLWDKEWSEDDEELYVPITHLLDAYYCLPERIDMSFTYLWKSINSVYSYFAIKKLPNQGLTEKDKIDIFINSLSLKLDETFLYNSSNYSIKQVIDDFVKLIPLKTLKFISNYVLKGIAIEIKGNLPPKYNTSQYKTFRQQFPALLTKIQQTYGQSYMDICNPIVKTGQAFADLQITDKDKSRRIIESLSKKFQELLINKTITFSNNTYTSSEIYSFSDDRDFLDFIFRIFLYGIRNSSIHGNKASRFNSDYANNESIKSSEFVFLLGHLFLSLLMYLDNLIDITDLKINIENTKLFTT